MVNAGSLISDLRNRFLQLFISSTLSNCLASEYRCTNSTACSMTALHSFRNPSKPANPRVSELEKLWLVGRGGVYDHHAPQPCCAVRPGFWSKKHKGIQTQRRSVAFFFQCLRLLSVLFAKYCWCQNALIAV